MIMNTNISHISLALHRALMTKIVNFIRWHLSGKLSSSTPLWGKWGSLTFKGASSSLWTPAICSFNGKCSFKSYCGGLRGSGKFVHTNGSESSRYCTRHVIVAMVHPWSQSLKVKLAFHRRFLFVIKSHIKEKSDRPTTRHCQTLKWNSGCSQIKEQSSDVIRKQAEWTSMLSSEPHTSTLLFVSER